MDSRRVVPHAPAGLTAILAAMLIPEVRLANATPPQSIGWSSFADFLFNLILFAPLGASLALSRVPARHALARIALARRVEVGSAEEATITPKCGNW